MIATRGLPDPPVYEDLLLMDRIHVGMDTIHWNGSYPLGVDRIHFGGSWIHSCGFFCWTAPGPSRPPHLLTPHGSHPLKCTCRDSFMAVASGGRPSFLPAAAVVRFASLIRRLGPCDRLPGVFAPVQTLICIYLQESLESQSPDPVRVRQGRGPRCERKCHRRLWAL